MEGRLAGQDVAFDAPADNDEDDAWQAPQYFLTDGQAGPGQLVEAEDLAEDSAAHCSLRSRSWMREVAMFSTSLAGGRKANAP